MLLYTLSRRSTNSSCSLSILTVGWDSYWLVRPSVLDALEIVDVVLAVIRQFEEFQPLFTLHFPINKPATSPHNEKCRCIRHLPRAESFRRYGRSSCCTCASWSTTQRGYSSNRGRRKQEGSPPPPRQSRQESQEDRYPRSRRGAAVHSSSRQRSIHGGCQLQQCCCKFEQQRCCSPRSRCCWPGCSRCTRRPRSWRSWACDSRPDDIGWTPSTNPC
ncbi:hypothetical protein JG688_00018441, partial [Phytophthora aleatoria]